MAKHVKITKIANKNNAYYYQITDENEASSLYMCIDQKHQQLIFYLNDNFNDPVGVIDFNVGNEKLDFSVLNRRLLWPAVSKGKQALNNNIFPDYLDYCA